MHRLLRGAVSGQAKRDLVVSSLPDGVCWRLAAGLLAVHEHRSSGWIGHNVDATLALGKLLVAAKEAFYLVPDAVMIGHIDRRHSSVHGCSLACLCIHRERYSLKV